VAAARHHQGPQGDCYVTTLQMQHAEKAHRAMPRCSVKIAARNPRTTVMLHDNAEHNAATSRMGLSCLLSFHYVPRHKLLLQATLLSPCALRAITSSVRTPPACSCR
jgi:hypothetical protein